VTKTIAFLKPLTPEAEISVGTQLFQVSQFPFRVGRKSRRNQAAHYLNARRQAGSTSSNDLNLIETKPPLNVSREHFQIESHKENFFIVDRGSTCGTLVEGVAIGGKRNGGQHPLLNGDVIIVGTSESRLIYKFIIEKA
jgi:pSer/pThr/pTyr-binding forkhead associated (FHA) protein